MVVRMAEERAAQIDGETDQLDLELIEKLVKPRG